MKNEPTTNSRINQDSIKDWVELFELLIKIDKKQNPDMYTNNDNTFLS